MEFKGTKGKWFFETGTHTIWHPGCIGQRLAFIDETKSVSDDDIANEWKYNALLISKAPEMLEMLTFVLKDYHNIISQSPARDNRINQIEQLIKEATEL